MDVLNPTASARKAGRFTLTGKAVSVKDTTGREVGLASFGHDRNGDTHLVFETGAGQTAVPSAAFAAAVREIVPKAQIKDAIGG
jgi:hypothetical protein